MAGTLQAAEVVVPTSLEDAASAFGDGSDVTVIAGGTIVVPELTHGRLRPRRAVLLTRAGLAGVRRGGAPSRVGPMPPAPELEGLPAPPGGPPRHVADV